MDRFAEYEEACINEYWKQHKPTWRYVTGDQANQATLEKWLETTKGGFDVILDDGGHTNPQIWNSFQFLFYKALKPGGIYFIEDIHVGRTGAWVSSGH